MRYSNIHTLFVFGLHPYCVPADICAGIGCLIAFFALTIVVETRGMKCAPSSHMVSTRMVGDELSYDKIYVTGLMVGCKS